MNKTNLIVSKFIAFSILSLAGCGNDAEFILVDGHEVRISSEAPPRSFCSVKGGSFGESAFGLSVLTDLPKEEILLLNGWEKVAGSRKPDGCYWLHPRVADAVVEGRRRLEEKVRSK